MGAWGTGVYDDDAGDWAYELADSVLATIDAGLLAVLCQDGCIEADIGARRLFAADVVARVQSGGGSESTPYV